jgi:hypothetical protein
MPNRLRLRETQEFMDAFMALEYAVQVEAERQAREQAVIDARIIALQSREATFQASPIAWPVTMMQPMGYTDGYVYYPC